MKAQDAGGAAPRLRVALVGSFPPQGQGIPDYCRELALGLATQCEITTLGYAAMYPAFLFPGDSAASIDKSSVAMSAPNLTQRRRLRWYNPFGWIAAALFTPADVFHIQHWSLPLIPIHLAIILMARMRGKPAVVTVHNVLPHERSPLFVFGTKLLCKIAKAVLAHSERNREQLIEAYGVPAKKVHRIEMGATVSTAKPITQEKARRELGIGFEEKVVLLQGHLRKYKGIEYLLEAFDELAKAEENARLIIAGTPWIDWKPYDEQIDALNIRGKVDLHLHFIPSDKLNLYYSATDLVVLPYTHFDAQSAIGAQVLPYRKPMIVTSVGALPEWVGGDNKWIVPPKDSQALARRLKDFFANQQVQSAEFEKLAGQLLGRFSWEDIAARHIEIYQGLRN